MENLGIMVSWGLASGKLDKIDVLTDSTVYRNHAEDKLGYGDDAIIGSQIPFGGVEKF